VFVEPASDACGLESLVPCAMVGIPPFSLPDYIDSGFSFRVQVIFPTLYRVCSYYWGGLAKVAGTFGGVIASAPHLL